MDNHSLPITDNIASSTPKCVNGSMRRPSSGSCGSSGAGGRPASLMDHNQAQPHVVRVVVNKDEKGYGMKVSGDNPVYVQSVKEGGAAERAGLQAGDKIIKVNGVNVVQSTHTEVVSLIRSSSQVVLTVQQRANALRSMGSPSLHTRPLTTPNSSRITGPQPVDNEKQHQLQLEKEKQYKLMIEKELHYVELLRSQIASSPDEKKYQELAKTERNLQTLQTMLHQSQNESSNSSATHHRTKSSPESLSVVSETEGGSRKLSESMNDLCRSQEGWEGAEEPPGTPPPPYLSSQVARKEAVENVDSSLDEDVSTPLRGNNSSRILANCSPIHAATPTTIQQPIISMEDDEISDQEISQLEDHGHFKSLSQLWDHIPHLAVFTNYVLSNSNPSSLLFYLLTDLYKVGNAKEMRKWAFEIHSCFLVPGAPLRLGNVDENIAREIDDNLTREFDKEEILRKIFWKARYRAKEELTRQLADFQQKRTAGLGTMFGPRDSELAEVYNDKAKELKLYEHYLLEKLEPYIEEMERDNFDPKKFYTGAALTTVLTRVFQVRPTGGHALDRCPMFVSKEKSFRTKFFAKYSRKLNVFGHQYVAQQYYTVIACNNCHQIIYGIGPQGYQCSACLINLHRQCVKLYDDNCPGPITKKDGKLKKFIGKMHEIDHGRIRKTQNFIQMEKERRQQEEARDSSFDGSESGEVKQSQPVSRSGSDRRPDSVREELVRHRDAASAPDQPHDAAHDKKDDVAADSTTSLPATGSKRRINNNIHRSESVKEQTEKRKQRRNMSDPSHNNTSVDADLERQPGVTNTDSGSSSNSSISYNGRLSESPSNSGDVAQSTTSQQRVSQESDSDMDVETEIDWLKLVPSEKLRQDVINELFHTERSHVRNLKVLHNIFYKRLQESQGLKHDELNLIFPNIKEMLDIHTSINDEMRKRRKEDPIVRELGPLLVGIFDDRQGESLKKAAATFCERQQLALEFIKKRRERDSKFDSILAECEKERRCRRLPFQGILPTEMQRLSKYPLLLERLINSVESNKENEDDQGRKEELLKLRRALHMSKEILNYVNDAAKLAHNRHRLEEIRKHLDTSAFERTFETFDQTYQDLRSFDLDLAKYKLIIEGGMQLRRPNKAAVPVHILLLEEAVLILHREGDRFLLKFFQSGSSTQQTRLSPIIRINTLLVRTNAVCKNALFLVNTSSTNSQMYDLIAEDEIKREIWFKHFSDATEAYNISSRRVGGGTDLDDTESVQEFSPSDEVAERAEEVGGDDNSAEDTAKEDESEQSNIKENDRTDIEEKETSPEEKANGGGGIETLCKISAEEWPLIQPSQVNIAVPPVHVAEAMSSPLEQIRKKDALVRQALEDKEGLVADMLSIPREHFQHIADMASMDNSSTRDPSERVLASIFQVDQLRKAVNEALNLSEGEVIKAKGSKQSICASQIKEDGDLSTPMTVPASVVRDIANSLSSQLTTLLSEVKNIEEERDRLRRELYVVKERLHEEHQLHSVVADTEINGHQTTDGTQQSLKVGKQNKEDKV